MKLYLRYDEFRSYIREPDLEDKWDSGDEQVDWSPVSLSTKPSKGFERIEEFEIDVKPKELWVVVLRYETGSTFGYISGEWSIEGYCKTAQDAERLEKEIRDGNAKNTLSKYVYWDGYFEKLENVEVHHMKVED